MVWPSKFDYKLGEFDAMELPGQQLEAAQAKTPLDHVLNLNIKAATGCQRLTGIMCSIGKASYDIETLEQMIAAGMNIAILNYGFGNKEDHVEIIKNIKQASKNYSAKIGRICPLAIAGWLVGRKIRTGRIAETYGDSVELKTGETVRITTDETYKDRCSASTIFVDYMQFSEQLKKYDELLIDNESILLIVDVISSSTVTCNIERGGELGSYKDVFVPLNVFDMPSFSEKDKTSIDLSVHHQFDIIVCPFTHSASTILELRSMIGEKGKKIAIVAKIQSMAGYKNFDEILEASQGIIISRQELGSDITSKKLVIAQKNMIARANKANIPVCVAAQLLSSMRTKKLPLRAELLDVSNCILDGADYLMLSSETAIGQYPIETVLCLANTCKEAEACVWTKQLFLDMLDKTPLPCDQTAATALSAALASQRCMAAAIIVVTTTGKSAQAVSKYKPRCPILAITRYPPIARQLHQWRGIIPLIYENSPEHDWQADLEKRVNFGSTWGLEQGFIRVGDPLILVSGWRQGAGFTNTMRIIYASSDTSIY